MRRLIPSMFHRRLVLLLGLFLVPLLPLVGQMYKLTLVDGHEHRREAESRLVRQSWTPTVRGRILDRHGRVLARDRPSYDIAVDYRVISGAWAEQRAGRFARRVHREEWPRLAAEERANLMDRYLPAYQAHIERMWRHFEEEADLDQDTLLTRRESVIDRVDRMHRSITDRRKRRALEAAQVRGRELTTEVVTRITRQAGAPIREQTSAHALAYRVPDEIGFRFLRLQARTYTLTPAGPDGPEEVVDLMPGLEVLDAGDRHYPFETMTVDIDLSTLPKPIRADGTVSLTVDGVGTHLLGWMRSSVQAEDIERRRQRFADDHAFATRVGGTGGVDRGRYQSGDSVGHFGIEYSREHLLRGLRGLRTTRLDIRQEVEQDPEPGQDVRLTIDAKLQARVQAIMDPSLGLARVQPWHGEIEDLMPVGTHLHGASVVLDIDTGEILAMVSTPTFTRDQAQDDADWVFRDPIDTPHVNRAIAKPYPPGSIAKALIGVGAVKRGNLPVDQRIECTGHLLEGRPELFRCWIFRERFGFTNHSVRLGDDPDLAESLAVSCNIFFYTLGRRMGARGVAEVYRMFGLTEPFDLGVGTEFVGSIGALDRGPQDGSDLSIQDAILMGIGQGPVAWTPLHAADTYATIARMGVRVPPRLVLGESTPAPRELELDPEAVFRTLEGLDLAVNDSIGTGHVIWFDDQREEIFDAPGVRVWGKTGTATAPSLVVDNEDGTRRVARAGNHSWFVILAGNDDARPRYAIAVLMEYAGSGGRVSGPIANQILHALLEEGYL